MGTILNILDFLVLCLLVLSVLRIVWKELRPGSGSLVLSICLAVALAIVAIVSLTAYMGLVEVSSTFTQAIFLLILLAMAALLRFAWPGKPVA